MQYTTILLAAFSAIAAAQLDLPPCATECFAQAIGNTTCGLTDSYCQCTSGQAEIQAVAIPCLCHSTCTSSDLIAIVQDTNKVCSSALAASSEVFTAQTLGLGACATATAPAGGAAAATTSAASGSAASATASGSQASSSGTAKASGSGSASSTASAAQQTATSGASIKMVYGEAVLGLAGFAAFVL